MMIIDDNKDSIAIQVKFRSEKREIIPFNILDNNTSDDVNFWNTIRTLLLINQLTIIKTIQKGILYSA